MDDENALRNSPQNFLLRKDSMHYLFIISMLYTEQNCQTSNIKICHPGKIGKILQYLRDQGSS